MLSHFMFWLGLRIKRIKNVNIVNAVWAWAPKNKGFSERTVTTGFTRLSYQCIKICHIFLNNRDP